MNHPHVLERLPLWVEGDLPSPEAMEVETHLVACPTCRAAAEAFAASQAWLKDTPEAPFTAADLVELRQEVLARIHAEATPRRRVRPLRPFLALAAAALCVLTGTLWTQGHRPRLAGTLAAIEEAVKRLDVAAPAPKEMELRVHVLYGSRQEGSAETLPPDLKDVVATLKGTLTYRSYSPVIDFVQRAEEGVNSLRGRGHADGGTKAGSSEVRFDWWVRSLAVEVPEAGPTVFTLKGFSLEATEPGGRSIASLMTDLSIKDGEKVVVGTTAFKDKGLIAIVTVRLLK